MITTSEYRSAQKEAEKLFKLAHIEITPKEAEQIEVVDFGLSNLETEGAQILTLVQTERISVKVLALMPYQTEPEHWHPPVGDDPGKEETVRHIYGDLLFYVTGNDTMTNGYIPEGKQPHYTCRHEIPMSPGMQLTCLPGDKHWFQAGERGAVLFSFSTVARDALDAFSNPNIERITAISDRDEQ